MKDGVIILNFARDKLVDDDAMAEALASGKVSRYVTDFPNEKTAGMEGVVAIPHLGASTEESEDNCAIMAAVQLDNYLRYGNIKNSVNFPAVSMPRSGDARICVLHENVPGMLTKLTAVMADEGLNIENMTNKSRGDYAYTMVDVNTRITDEVAEELRAIPGMLRVRVLTHRD